MKYILKKLFLFKDIVLKISSILNIVDIVLKISSILNIVDII